MNLSESGIGFIHQTGNGIYRSKWIVCNQERVVEDSFLEIENGIIKTIFKTKPRGKVRDLGPGVMLPALVNGHTHLELSALKGAVPFDRGFSVWVQQLLAKREAMGEDLLELAARNAAQGLVSHGTAVIGEISTLGITRDILQDQDIFGVWFQEILGGMEIEGVVETGSSLSFSLAGHAPHTTSPDKLREIKGKTSSKGLVFSIHLAESRVESEFLETGKGQWADFLGSRGIDTKDWPLGNITPVQYLNRLGLLDKSTLAVHLLRANTRDFEILAQNKVRICLCPRSNENLHARLPDLGLILKKGLQPALGTDSLASCESLSLFDEMAFVRRRFPDVPPEIVFSMATMNGAGALGLGRYWGSLEPGKRACFLYVDFSASNEHQIFERLTTNEI